MKPAVVCTCVALWMAAPVVAGPDRFAILVGSQHFGVSEGAEFNEFNPGVFLTWERPGYDLSLAAFYNSYETVSLAALTAVPLVRTDDFAVDFFGGLAWYPNTGLDFPVTVAKDVLPVFGIEARYGHVFVQVIPLDGGVADAILAAGLTFDAN